MARGISIWVDGTVYSSVDAAEEALEILRSLMEDYRHDVLVIQVTPRSPDRSDALQQDIRDAARNGRRG